MNLYNIEQTKTIKRSFFLIHRTIFCFTDRFCPPKQFIIRFFYLSTDFMDPPSFPLIECLRITNMHPPGTGPGLMMMNELIAVATGASPTTPSSTPHSPLLHLGVELEQIKGGARARNGAL
jgi:hypothetical protein